MKRVLLTLCVAAGVAHADTGTLPGGATMSFKRLFLHEHNSKPLVEPAKPESLWKYFNLAHCVCSQPGASTLDTFVEKTFAYEILLTGQTTPINRPAEIWVGASCDDPIMRPVNCHRVDSASIANIADLQTRPATPELPVFDLMVPEAMSAGCTPRALSAAEWVIADTKATGTPDYFLSKAIDTDSLAPPLPTVFRADGAENAIQISWDAPTGDVADIYYYQALCATAAGDPAKPTHQAPQYVTAKTLCDGPTIPLKPTVIDMPSDGGIGVDANPSVNLPEGLANLDPNYICGENPEKTATSLRIDGLENGKPYTVVLLAIDKFGNAAGTYFVNALTPKPVTDFWEDLHANGSKAEGGYCLIAETYGDGNPLTQHLRTFRDETLAETAFGRWVTSAYYGSLGKLGALVHGHVVLRIIAGVLLLPLVAFAFAWHVLTLPGLLALLGVVVLYRNRRRTLAARAAAAVIVFIVLAPARAHAQTPYWEDQSGNDTTAVADQPSRVSWHAGVRIGPYIPQIDAQLGKMPGPYVAMFGTSSNKTAYAILPMLDVERIVWRGFGQLGFGGSVGYMGKSAHAFVDGSDPADPNRPRASGDMNSFRLIPLAATAVYRFTWLDDEYGIPVVPYARGGLAYYVWWVSGPSGDFAKVCKGAGTEPTCMQNTADGASLGVQGSVGFAIRAERIDATAAQSMHNSGLEHAGFYAEFQFAKVDGFGSAKKLSVGDNTWFAGVDFEF